MKLRRDLGIAQSSAWYMGQLIRETWNEEPDKFAESVEVYGTYIGGEKANKHEDNKLRAGRGTVGKAAVAGVRNRVTGRVNIKAVGSTRQRSRISSSDTLSPEPRSTRMMLLLTLVCPSPTRRLSTARMNTSGGWLTLTA